MREFGMFGQLVASCVLTVLFARETQAMELPGAYFRLMEVGIKPIQETLGQQTLQDLGTLESGDRRHRLFPHLILVAAVLYCKQDPSNHSYQNPELLSLALKIGDLLSAENERGSYEPRLNSDRDSYMWLESYRLLEQKLGRKRRNLWQRALRQNIGILAQECAVRTDFPGFQSPFIGTSPNHLSLWASTVYLAGHVFHNHEWEELGERIMHRFVAEEQSQDGFWGEHEKLLPTPGYDYTTYSGVALYWEWSQDAAALKALRQGLNFHKFFTYPDGSPVEVLDDRNRFTEVAGWGRVNSCNGPEDGPAGGGNDESASKGQFGFSNFSDGRGYAEFLTSFFQEGCLGYEDLGRIAQNALYYHAGLKELIPQNLSDYARQLTVPASIRKSHSWVVCLSGLIGTQAVTSQFYHDRQGHLSIFHERLGLIITGANSKCQPELATFSEKLVGRVFYMPLSSRLSLADVQDRLSLAYNTFFADLLVSQATDRELKFRFVITGKDEPPTDAQLTLQLCLRPGEVLETATGKSLLVNSERIELGPSEIGEWVRHHGWTLKTNSRARLIWPVFPHNPYTNSPETRLDHAVGALSIPLLLKQKPEQEIRPGEQQIELTLQVN